MNYRVFHTHSSCMHDWEFDFSGVWSTNQQGHGLIPKLSAFSASVRHVFVHCHCMLTISSALNAMYYEPSACSQTTVQTITGDCIPHEFWLTALVHFQP